MQIVYVNSANNESNCLFYVLAIITILSYNMSQINIKTCKLKQALIVAKK